VSWRMFWRTRRWALVRFTEYEISEFFDSEMGLSAEISTKSPPKKNKNVQRRFFGRHHERIGSEPTLLKQRQEQASSSIGPQLLEFEHFTSDS
jgi:hypothetical protein